VPHDVERVDVNAQPADFRYRGNLEAYKNALHGGPVRANVIKAGKRLPEIYRMDPDHHTIADCAVQKMWWGLNPDLNAMRMSSLMDDGLMLMNGGAGLPNHINCLTGEGKEYTTYPRFDEARLFAGTFVLVLRGGGIAYISSMLTTEPIKRAEDVEQQWRCWATSVDPQGVPHLITRPSGVDSDGPDVPVQIPIITAEPVWLPWDELHWLPPEFVPPSSTLEWATDLPLSVGLAGG
jgi:hypothetical protein